MLFTALHGRDRRRSASACVIYRLPLLQVAPRARLVGVARSGVPRQQLDPAVLGVLRPVRHDVPDAERGGRGRAPDRRSAVLQQVDAADRAGAAPADRHRAAARLAQVVDRQPRSTQFAWPVAATIVTGAAVYALGIRVWASGLCFALCAFVAVTIAAGVRPRRRRCARARPAPTSSPRWSVSSAARAAATAATSSTSASC